MEKIKKLGLRNIITIVLISLSLVIGSFRFWNLTIYMMGLFGGEWILLFFIVAFFLQLSKLKSKYKPLIFSILIILLLMAMFLCSALRPFVSEIIDPITNRSFIVVDYFPTHAIYYEQASIFLHLRQELRFRDSEGAPQSVSIDASGLHMVGSRGRATFPLYEELDWVNLPFDEIIITRHRQENPEVDEPRLFAIIIGNIITFTDDLSAFRMGQHSVSVYTKDTSAYITEAQYQKVRRLLADAPLANRDCEDTPQYRISVREEQNSRNAWTHIYVQGNHIFNEIIAFKEG